MATRTKKIGGKAYKLYGVYQSRWAVKDKKEELKKKGKHVRVVELSGVRKPYALYVR